MIHDEGLAAEVAELEKEAGVKVETARQQLRAAVERRYAVGGLG